MNAIDFECPVCGAKPGQRCHTLTGKANPVSHAQRKRAALDQEHSMESPKPASKPPAPETTER